MCKLCNDASLPLATLADSKPKAAKPKPAKPARSAKPKRTPASAISAVLAPQPPKARSLILPGFAGSQTHEAYISAVVRAILAYAPEHVRATLGPCKVVYGVGHGGSRGTTYYEGWQAPDGTTMTLIAIHANGQESMVQVCGTVAHELGHLLAGHGAGHGLKWFEACASLGLGGDGCLKIRAAGTEYAWGMFAPELRDTLAALAEPVDGLPRLNAKRGSGGLGLPKGQAPRPCGLGAGTRGGLSRGTGSGSRMLKWVCKCLPKPQIVRHAGTELAALCTRCNEPFALVEDSLPQAHTNGLGHAGAVAAYQAAQAPHLGTPASLGAVQPTEPQTPTLPPDYQAVPF